MNRWTKVKPKVPARRTVLRWSFVLILIWLCRRRATKLDFVQMTHPDFDISNNADSYYSSTPLYYDPLKAKLGSIFFRRLINENDSHKLVNEENLCSLMHFFIQQATFNNRRVQFTTGTFILYDSTGRFFSQLMMAKNLQSHSDEHRSGYARRLQYFISDAILFLWGKFTGHQYSATYPLIYLRGDESSHFHERGTKYERWHDYPAYGADIRHGCLPNHFGHILFGKLKSLPDSINSQYGRDRIYIKPEEYGLQRFPHYIAHGVHYIKSKLHFIACRWISRWNKKLCLRDGAFHEWTDRSWLEQWERILSTLTHVERRRLHHEASSNGIQEIYRQTHQFLLEPTVEKFRRELENHYGYDVSARKGNEIILTTEQLLKAENACDATTDSAGPILGYFKKLIASDKSIL